MPLLDSMFHLFSFSRHGIHLFSERKSGVVEKDPANIKYTIPPWLLYVCYLKILGDFQAKNWLPHSLFMAYVWLMFDIQDSWLAAHCCRLLPVFFLLVLFCRSWEWRTHMHTDQRWLTKCKWTGQEHEEFCFWVTLGGLLPHSCGCVMAKTQFMCKEDLSCKWILWHW